MTCHCPPPPFRRVAYISPERRVLWSESQGEGPGLDDGRANGGAGPPRRDALLDAAFATRMPQRGKDEFGAAGLCSIKAFPDFGPTGRLMGVIEVVESRSGGTTDVHVRRDRDVHSVLDLTLCGIILYDPDADRIRNVNRRVAQQTGYTVAELEGMPGRDLFGGNGAALLRSIHHRMARAGEGMVWGQMLNLRSRDGGRERYFASLRPIEAVPEENAPTVMLVSLDAAEMDEATGSAREGPNPRFVMEAMQDGLWEYDARRRVFHYGESYGDIFGPDGLPGGPGKPLEAWLEETYPGEPRQLMHEWRQLIKGGVRYRTSYRIRDRRGRWRWVVSTIHAILNDGRGRPAWVLGFHMDISDVMRSETRLIDTEERFRAIFDNAGMGIAVCGLDGLVQRANPALTVMLGRDETDLKGGLLERFAHPDHRAELNAALVRLTRGGRRECVPETPFIRRDGRKVWITFTATLSRRISDGARYIIVMAEDVTVGRADREKLQYEATHDVMTGAWSRWVMLERLEQHLQLAQRHGQPLTYCICDLDHFKRVNDDHGHQAGDAVLIRFVAILKESVRETDIVGRYGGEEFGVVFPSTDPDGALQSLRRAADALRGHRFDGPRGPFHVTATFGVAAVRPDHDLRSLVAAADAALYEGKESGRDRIVLAEASTSVTKR